MSCLNSYTNLIIDVENTHFVTIIFMKKNPLFSKELINSKEKSKNGINQFNGLFFNEDKDNYIYIYVYSSP